MADLQKCCSVENTHKKAIKESDMFTPISFSEPAALKVGAKYKLMKKNNNEEQVTYEDVSFLSYTSSPEMVVVKADRGQVLKVARYEVLETFKEK
jgi:hypothetical protein